MTNLLLVAEIAGAAGDDNVTPSQCVFLGSRCCRGRGTGSTVPLKRCVGRQHFSLPGKRVCGSCWAGAVGTPRDDVSAKRCGPTAGGRAAACAASWEQGRALTLPQLSIPRARRDSRV